MEKKVLLIEDEESLRRSISFGLMQKGYKTEPCQNGLAALKTLEMIRRKGMPLDYVVVDFRLPDIDGVKLLKVIKFKYPNLPVILVTGYGDHALQEVVKSEKADGYLDKPFSVDELAEVFDDLDKKQPKASLQTAEQTNIDKSLSAYAMIKINDKVDPVGLLQKLYYMEDILFCDATRGEFDIVLILQNKTLKDIEKVVNKIKAMEGIEELVFMPTETPVLSDETNEIINDVDDVLDKNKIDGETVNNANYKTTVASYVMLEIEKEKIENIYPTLHFNDNVIYSDFTNGKYDAVLLMQAPSFKEIDRVINEKIKNLDGVLKIKECPIIKVFEM